MADAIVCGLDVPKNCASCRTDLAVAVNCIYTQRIVLQTEHDVRAGRHPDCPIIPLKEGRVSRYMLMYIRPDGTAAYEPFEGTPQMLRERLALLDKTRPEGARPAQWARLTGGGKRYGKAKP